MSLGKPLKQPSAYLPVVILFVVGLLLRLALASGFDGLYGQDAYAYYNFAGELRNAAADGRALEPFFWPLGYPVLLLISFSLFGESAAAAQIITMLMGAALAPMVYGFARQLRIGLFAALLAGVLMAICGQAAQSSIVIMADIPALFWATLSALLLCWYLNKQHPAILTAVAGPLVFAAITRWLYLALVIPFGLALLVDKRWRLPWRRRLQHIGFATSAAILILIPQVIFSLNSSYPTFNHAWVVGWSPLNAFAREFINVDGHFSYAQINAVFYAAPFYDPYYLAPIFIPLMLLGAISSWRNNAAYGVLLSGWIALPYLFLIGIPYQNIRFALIIVPPAMVLVGKGMNTLGALMIRHGEPLSTPAVIRYSGAGVVLLLGLAGVGQMVHATQTTINAFVSTQQRDKEAAAWVAARVPEGETLYTFGLTLTLAHYTNLEVRELFYETPQTLATNWQTGREDYLLLNVWQIENQWMGMGPQIAYHWLRDERGLTILDRFGNYTLFRIGG